MALLPQRKKIDSVFQTPVNNASSPNLLQRYNLVQQQQNPTTPAPVSSAPNAASYNAGVKSNAPSLGQQVINAGSGIVKGIAQSYNTLGKGIGTVAGYYSGDAQNARDAQTTADINTNAAIQHAKARLVDPTVSADEKARQQQFIINTAKQSANDFGDTTNANDQFIKTTDPVRNVAALGSIGADILTGGEASGGFKAAKAAADGLTGSAARNAVIKNVAGQSLKSGALAAPSGALSPVVENGNQANAKDIGLGAVTGFGVGAVLPGAEILGESGLRSAFGKSSKVLPVAKTIEHASEELPRSKETVGPVINGTDITPEIVSPTTTPIAPLAPATRDVPSTLPTVTPKSRYEVVQDGPGRARVQAVTPTYNPAGADGKAAQDLLQAQQLAERPTNAYRESTMAPTLQEQGDQLVDPLMAAQDREAERYNTSTLQKVRSALGSNLYDPRNVEQRMDNSEFSRLKKLGQTRKGQSELLPEQSLATLRGKIENPYQAANVRDNTKYATDAGNLSVNDIIKMYGKQSGNKARSFENYRIYKDELQRISMGEEPTIAVDPSVMKQYVDQYERINPSAIAHNQALRAKSLSDAADLERAGVIPAGTVDRLSANPFYAPRKVVAPEELNKMGVSGGIRSGQKGVKERTGMNAAPTSPLSIYKEGSVNTEKDLANQLYGNEIRRRLNEGALPGGKEVLNADTVIQHKNLQQQAKDISNQISTAKNVRDQLAKDTTKSKSAYSRSVAQAKKAEDAAVKNVKDLIAKARGDSSNVLNDLADRDPRYAAEAEAIKSQDLPNLTAQERKDQIKYDLSQLDKKYPQPKSLTRDEALTLAKTIAKGEGEPGGKAIVTKKLSANAKSALEDVQSMLRQSRQDLADLTDQSKDVNGELRATSQNVDRNTQAFQYRVNGEVGKIDLPGELANSLSKQNERAVQSVIDKGLKPVGNAQKLTWTGILQPSFKVYNTLVKNPLLMFLNADGLSGVRPEATASFARQIVNTPKMQAFKNQMQKRGMAYENAFQSRNIDKQVADDIAARANIVSFFARNPAKTLGDVWRGVNHAAASLDNAQRYAVSYGAYKRALDQGFPEKEALDIGSQASAKVFGDFDRVTQLAQGLEAIIPYTGATQAGVRAIARSARTRPIETAAKATIIGAGMGGLAAYSIANASDYYKDMINQGKTYQIDNNWTIALPGAHKDPATGKWSGIINVPLLPDVRPMNRAIWRQVYNLSTGGKLDPSTIAYEAFNQATGDVANQVYDPSRAQNGQPAAGVLPSSPIANIVKTGLNVNTYDGSPLADEYTASRPRTEQTSATTSKGAQEISNLTKGVVTPLQADQLLSQLGSTGDVVQDPGNTKNSLVGGLLKPLQPGTSQKTSQQESTAYYNDVDKVKKSIQDEKTYKQFEADHAKGTEEDKADLLSSAKKVQQYYSISDGKFQTTDQFKAEKYLDQLQRQQGQPGNPLFDLPNDQLQKVLEYRSSKMLNQGKQSYDKNGTPLFTSLGLDEKWYSDYQDKESAYYDGIKSNLQNQIANSTGSAKQKAQQALDNLSNDNPATFSGAQKPSLSADQQKYVDYYYTLPNGTGEKSAFLKANPWLLDYWNASDGFSNKERSTLALADTDNSQSSGNSSGSSGSGYSSYSRSSGSSSPKALDARKYAISLNAGGSAAKPTVTVKKSSGSSQPKKYTARKSTISKPKVTLKQSKV